MKLIDTDKLIEELTVDPVECPGCPEPEWLGELIQILEEEPSVGCDSGGVYECFHCGARSVIWDCDFTFEDYGYDGEGLIQECHCENCGASITYMIPYGDPEEE